MDAAGSRERLDLCGAWQLAFDPAQQGVRAGWPQGRWPEEACSQVQVPALWNVTHPEAEGVGFYRKVFVLPAHWRGRVVRLHFGGASYRAEAWLNGAYVGSHEGAYTPFCFDVTRLVRPGTENQLVVRVAALSRATDVDGMPLAQCPASKQSWYYPYGGLWGEVFLESLPLVFCDSIAIEPDLERESVQIEVTVGNAGVQARTIELHLTVSRPDGALAAEERSRLAVPPGAPVLSYRLPLPRPMRWDCENPNLYRVGVALADGREQVDSHAASFGMRDFSVRDGQFFLNGEPIYLRGVLLQPNYPITLIAPHTREIMVRELTLIKEAGFNLVRAHIRPAPPGYLDLTDRMGLLVYAESCLAWIRDSPRLLDHGRRELRAMIERDRNHPSVVIWGINNENRAANAINSDDLTRFVRALDPTRVVLDNSGGTMAIDQDFGWADRTTVIPSREVQRQPIQDLHIYIGSPIPPPAYEWMRTLGVSPPPVDMACLDFGSPAALERWSHDLRSYRGKVFVSELGCGGMADLDRVVAGFEGHEHLRDAREMQAFRDSLRQGFAERGLDRIFGQVGEMIRASQEVQAAGLRRQIEALLANPRVSGYIVTQLNDVAWEFHAGLLDHWRNPKMAYQALRRLQCARHHVILKAARPVVACGERIEVALTLVRREPGRPGEELEVSVRGPSGVDGEPRALAGGHGPGTR
ncbi:MAG: glycoside hydrolase family 2 TIM barrel-domain containing protein, partial [Anaerolineae bacterium]|nr:glycoside hydrolase family 2 TIM barrel-domain containing protein [Anaerolineae bacterium]